MWSKTSQQREIFTKLSRLPSSQRICSSRLMRDGFAVLIRNGVPSLHHTV